MFRPQQQQFNASSSRPSLLKLMQSTTLSGPYATVAAAGIKAAVLYAVIMFLSISVSIASDSLSLRLNSFMALHALVTLVGSLLALAGSNNNGKDDVLDALGLLLPSSSEAAGADQCSHQGHSCESNCGGVNSHTGGSSCGDNQCDHEHHHHGHSHGDGGITGSCESTSSSCSHGHSHDHHGSACIISSSHSNSAKAKAVLASSTLVIRDECRAAFPSDHLNRLKLIAQYAADIIVFFAAASTVVEAVHKLGHHHDAYPSSAHLLSLAHVLVVLFHYKNVVRWAGEGGRRSPFLPLAANPIAVSPSRDVTAMLCSPIACAVGCLAATHSGNSRIDVLAALLLSIYCGLWSGRRLVDAAHILAARNPLSQGGGGGMGMGGVGISLGSPSTPFASLTRAAKGGGNGSFSSSAGGGISIGSSASMSSSSTAPSSLAVAFQRVLMDVRMIRGVLEVKESVLWPRHGNGSMSGTVRVTLSRDGSEESVGAEVRRLFEAYMPMTCTNTTTAEGGGGASSSCPLIIECERQFMPTVAAMGGMLSGASTSNTATGLMANSTRGGLGSQQQQQYFSMPLPPPPPMQPQSSMIAPVPVASPTPSASNVFANPSATTPTFAPSSAQPYHHYPLTGSNSFQLPPPPALPTPAMPFPFPRSHNAATSMGAQLSFSTLPPPPPAPSSSTSAAMDLHSV